MKFFMETTGGFFIFNLLKIKYIANLLLLISKEKITEVFCSIDGF